MKLNRPIGIFDSGIGGLTVASAIQKVLPNEPLVYYGDTAHLPYGDKSKETIIRYSNKIVDFLHDKNCRTIVIACNTASSFAADFLQEKWGSELKIINVIDPVVDYLKKINRYQNIGIIGTKGTIQSGIYPRKLGIALPGVKVSSLATPLLASLIEEGYFNNSISTAIIQDYISKDALKGIDCLVLACTHYPLIKTQISSVLGNSVDILDSSTIVADYLAQFLETKAFDFLANSEVIKQAYHDKNEFYVSDFTESFQKSTALFFGDKIELKKV